MEQLSSPQPPEIIVSVCLDCAYGYARDPSDHNLHKINQQLITILERLNQQPELMSQELFMNVKSLRPYIRRVTKRIGLYDQIVQEILQNIDQLLQMHN